MSIYFLEVMDLTLQIILDTGKHQKSYVERNFLVTH